MRLVDQLTSARGLTPEGYEALYQAVMAQAETAPLFEHYLLALFEARLLVHSQADHLIGRALGERLKTVDAQIRGCK
jgi:hypothetical protein